MASLGITTDVRSSARPDQRGRLAPWSATGRATYAYRARALHRPAHASRRCWSCRRRAPRIRVLGTRHSFNAHRRLRRAHVARRASRRTSPSTARAGTVACSGGVTYGALAADARRRRGSRSRNLASLPHISVAGAVATATHGSGDANGNLATAVAALELVDLRRRARHASRRGDAGLRRPSSSALGALGAVTRIDARRRARLRRPPGRLRGARVGRAARALRRDLRERLQPSACSRAGARPSTRSGSRAACRRARGARRALRRAPGDRRPPSDPRQRPRPRDGAARPARAPGRSACRTSA